MLNLLKNEANKTYTENGAVTYKSTLSDCLDLFATIGAFRHRDEEDIVEAFQRAYAEDPDMAMKILFYARDVRGGLGERRTFRTIINWLAAYNDVSVKKNIRFIAEYGRFDDLVSLLGTSCEKETIKYIKRQLEADLTNFALGKPVSLMAKWLPSVNATNKETIKNAKHIAKALGMSDAEYRKVLSKLRSEIRIIENNLREKDYTFDYSKQPSKALLKYRGAFMRNDHERYSEYLNDVADGKTRMNTGTLTPYDIITPVVGYYNSVSELQRKVLNTTWNALEDFTRGENAIVVIDGSGSMYSYMNPMPASVALSLGIYFAERNKGAFKNHFITFSNNPQLVEVKGNDIVDKVQYCRQFDEIAGTNIQAVFELILKTAIKNNVSQAELPATIYIISDMEFNYCTYDAGMNNFEYARKLFSSRGYKLPKVVFWNVASRNRQQPVTMNEQGVALVSGCNPRLFSMVLDGDFSPYSFMMDVLGAKRYECIVA